MKAKVKTILFKFKNMPKWFICGFTSNLEQWVSLILRFLNPGLERTTIFNMQLKQQDSLQTYSSLVYGQKQNFSIP